MEFKYTKEVEDTLLYTFKNKDLLLQAFLTPRYAKEHNLKSYNHLKVIGESIISFLFMKCLDKNFGSFDSKTSFYELKHFENIEDIYTQEKQMINDDMLCNLIKVFNFDKYINNGDITTEKQQRNKCRYI